MMFLDGAMGGADRAAGKMTGLVTGVVKENWNQSFPGKLKVELVLGEQGKNATGWIPAITPYGGDGCGLYLLPEVGTEVAVAFLMGDRNCPVVLGALWNNKNKLPSGTANEKNTVKALKTKGGLELVFDDAEKKAEIRMTSPGKFTICINDEKKTISLGDEKGENGILIDAGKGTVKVSAKNSIELKAGNSLVKLDGQGKSAQVKAGTVELEASQSVKIKGQNDSIESAVLNIKAKSSLKMESSLSAELKGQMLKLN